VARNDKSVKRAGRKQLMAQAAWAYQSAGLLLMAPDTFRSETARERAREWLLDVLADTAAGRTARVGLIAYAEATERGSLRAPEPVTEPLIKRLPTTARKR
jgi:hypothetical protein